MINYETHSAFMIHKSHFTKDIFLNLKSKMSTLDFNAVEKPVAFYLVKDQNNIPNYVLIPKIPRKYLDHIFKKELIFKFIYNNINDKVQNYKLTLEPLPHQHTVIRDVMNVMNNKFKRRSVGISLSPGLGKTYMASNVIFQTKNKFLFMVNNSDVLKQSKESMSNILGTPKNLYMLTEGAIFEQLRNNKNLYGLYMTHRMFDSLKKRLGIEVVEDILNSIGINMVIFDEFDMEVGNLYTMLSYLNFEYSIFLTGTPFKSLPDDDRVFQLIFRDVPFFGHDIKVEKKKDIHFINWKFSPTPGESFQIKSKQTNAFKLHYNNNISKKDILVDYIMNKYYTPENSIFKQVADDRETIVFFVGRIEHCEWMKGKLMNEFKIDERDIGIINTNTKDRHRKENMAKPFLISLTSSLGRGIDAKNFRVLIFLSFSFSRSEFMQSISRVGRVNATKQGLVIYPVDQSFNETRMNYESKLKNMLFANNFKSMKYDTIPESSYSNYYYGYSHHSERALYLKKMAEEKQKKKQLQLKNFIR